MANASMLLSKSGWISTNKTHLIKQDMQKISRISDVRKSLLQDRFDRPAALGRSSQNAIVQNKQQLRQQPTFNWGGFQQTLPKSAN